MSTRRKAFEGGSLLAASRVGSQVLALGRNVFIARILTPEDYGLAATFWITTGLLATITEFGFQQRLIQAKDGDDDRVGAVAQSLFVFRGLLIGAVLLAVAGPVARLFDAPEATWAFQLLALLPVLGGFKHRDLDRVKRHLNFKPEVATKLVPEVIITLAAVPIALATRDYSTFLFIALIKTAMVVSVSHWLAERPFRLGWDRQIVGRFMGFGWPLLINSLLMYGTMQGDRIILAGAYTKEELGVYSVAIGLVSAVLGMVTSAINPMALPLMARVQDDRATFEKHYRLHVTAMAAIAAFAGAGFILLGPQAITLVYGSKYALATVVVGWLGVSQSLRLLRVPAMNAAMARGDTRITMYTNVFRQSGILFALMAAWRGLPLEWIAISGVAGEMAALVVSGVLLNRRHDMPTAALWKPAAFVITCHAAAIAIILGGDVASSWLASVIWFLVIATVASVVYLRLFPGFRLEVQNALGAIRRLIASRTMSPTR